jgi:hypothetical protein
MTPRGERGGIDVSKTSITCVGAASFADFVGDFARRNFDRSDLATAEFTFPPITKLNTVPERG